MLLLCGIGPLGVTGGSKRGDEGFLVEAADARLTDLQRGSAVALIDNTGVTRDIVRSNPETLPKANGYAQVVTWQGGKQVIVSGQNAWPGAPSPSWLVSEVGERLSSVPRSFVWPPMLTR